jgi:hypothetical protein
MDRQSALRKIIKLIDMFHGSDLPHVKETAKRQALSLAERFDITRHEIWKARGGPAYGNSGSAPSPKRNPEPPGVNREFSTRQQTPIRVRYNSAFDEPTPTPKPEPYDPYGQFY